MNMKFKTQFLPEIKTPILIPEHFILLGINNGEVRYKNMETEKESCDEPLFLHDETKIFLNQFRTQFPNDSVIIILFNSSNNIYLHRRSALKNWAPNKIDLASIAGQRRALLIKNNFKNEAIEKTALREISEETGIEKNKLFLNKLYKIGIHHNPHTDEYQTVFTYQTDISLYELNKNIQKNNSQEVAKWFEQDYQQTINEYFGKEVNKYAGGEKMRPVNFISNPTIRKKLDEFFNEINQ